MSLTLAERNSFGQIGRGGATTPPIPPLVEGFLSWQAVTWVLEQSEAMLGSRLVILSIASHANREGKSAFPSLDTITKETLLSRREVIYAVQSLEESGELSVHRGIGRGNPNHYELRHVSAWLQKVQGLHQLEKTKGATRKIKGAINASDSKAVESTTSPLQPLGTVKDITVKSVARSLSVPRTVKSQKELLAERDRQIAAMREKGYIQ